MTATARPAHREGLHVLWEGFIVVLVFINLWLILFDSLFALQPLEDLLARWLPEFHGFYAERIHSRFALIDLAFVAVFLLDVLIGWTVALFERRYARWYYYPFAHWYDVLGCIPLSGFRWLRVLRIAVLLVRLQRLGWIDMRRWALYEFVNRYWQLLLEELSDRVMVKLFSRMQQEIGSSDDLARRLIDGVVRPRKERVLKDLDRRLSQMLEQGYLSNRAAIERYVGDLIHQALSNNSELRNLRRLPMGGRMADTLDTALSDIAARLIQSAVSGLHGEEFRTLASRLTDELFEAWLHDGADSDFALEELLVDIIEVLKQQILDRRWTRFVGPPAPEPLIRPQGE